MKSRREFKDIKYFHLFLLVLLLGIVNIADGYSFLSNMVREKISLQDVITYVVYGINTNARSSLIDILRSSIPYLLIIFFSGIYLTDILDDRKKYLYLIRYRKYTIWLKRTIIKIIIKIIIFFACYFFVLIVIGLLFIHNRNGFTEVFYKINPYYSNQSSNFIIILIYQYLLSITFASLMAVIQTLLSIYLNDAHKGFILVSLATVIISFLGIYNIYNPFMLSKQSIFNVKTGIHPGITILINIIISILVNIFTIKTISISVRRDGI